MNLKQFLTDSQCRLIQMAIEAQIPILVTGDRSKATGKTTLCDWLRALGAAAYEDWELEEGRIQPDDDNGRNTVYVTIRLNKPASETTHCPEGKPEPMWRRFELCVKGAEKEELYALLDRLNLTRHELALIVMGLRARPGFSLADFDT